MPDDRIARLDTILGAVSTRLEEFRLHGDIEDQQELDKLYYYTCSDFCHLLNTGISYYRILFRGQKDEYIDRVALVSMGTDDSSSDEINFHTKKIEVDTKSVVGFMGCGPEKRNQIYLRVPGPINISPFLEVWNVDDVVLLGDVLRGRIDAIGQSGFTTGSILSLTNYEPGDPIGRIIQLVRGRDHDSGQPIPFNNEELPLIRIFARLIFDELKRFEEAVGISNSDMFKSRAEFLEKDRLVLRKELRHVTLALKKQTEVSVHTIEALNQRH